MALVLMDNDGFYKNLNLLILSWLSFFRDEYICCNKNNQHIHQIKQQWQLTTATPMAVM